ncbi:MAG: hypothetical protein Q9163_000256 [Psora crenata]
MRDPSRPLFIGSVKTNIGHMGSASGLAGLIKAVLCLEKGMIPSSINFETENLDLQRCIRFAKELEPWPSGSARRYVFLNSFGYGGANAHVILDAYKSDALKGATNQPFKARDTGAFRGIDDAAVGGGQALGHVRIPNTASIMPGGIERPHEIHPSMLDACIYMTCLIHMNGGLPKVPMVLTFIKEVNIASEVPRQAAGGVGQAAVMLAQHIEADIYVSVGSDKKKDRLMKVYNILEDHFSQLEGNGFKLAIYDSDVGDREQLDGALCLCSKGMPPIEGVIDLAMVIRDAFARYRTSLGMATRSMDVGMLEDAGAFGPSKVKELVAVIDSAISRPIHNPDYCQLMIGLSDPHAETQAINLNDAKVSHIRSSRQSGTASAASQPSWMRSQLQNATSDPEIYSVLRDAIVFHVARVLVVPAEDINASQSISRHEGDSLSAVELRNWFAGCLEAPIGVMEILSGESIALVKWCREANFFRSFA